MTPTATPTADNGVNVALLLCARITPDRDPGSARLDRRAGCPWIAGTHGRATIESNGGPGGERLHHQSCGFEVVTNPTDITVTSEKA